MTATPQHEIDYDLAYDDGHKAAEERFAPLIEAARAYRDALDSGVSIQATELELLEAARTFEAGG